MRLKMTKMTKNPNIVLGHFFVKALHYKMKFRQIQFPLPQNIFKSLRIDICVVTKSTISEEQGIQKVTQNEVIQITTTWHSHHNQARLDFITIPPVSWKFDLPNEG